MVLFTEMVPLLDALADDLELAFPRLVEEHQGAVYVTALRCTGCRQAAEDIAQETFVRAYRSLAAWPAERIAALRPRAWLLRITLNAVRNRARDASRRPRTAELGDHHPEPAGGPEAAALGGERRELLAAALGRLPEEQRIPVVLRHVAGLRYDEIAEATERPVGTVKAQVHRGLRRLASLVDRTLLESET